MARGFQSTRERSTGLTLIELLVVIAILAILAGLLLPAVQSARETARRTHCQNHLKQIGLALHHYNDTLKRLPPGWIADDPLGEPGWGLLAYTLPFLELGNLHDQIDFHSGIAKTVNQTGRLQQIPGFLCPSDRALDRFELGRLSGDIGEGSDWEAGSKQGCPLGFGFHSTQVSPPDAAGRIYVSKGNYSGVFGDHAIGESLAAGRGLAPV